MMTIPRSVMKELDLHLNEKVNVTVEDGRLVAVGARPRYTLEELLAQCEPEAPWDESEREWMEAPAVGHEQID